MTIQGMYDYTNTVLAKHDNTHMPIQGMYDYTNTLSAIHDNTHMPVQGIYDSISKFWCTYPII